LPRCQRTFRRLSQGETVPGTGVRRWACSYCPDAEIYEAVRDADLNEYVRLAYDDCVAAFGTPPGDAAWPTVLVLGLRPECVREADEKRYDLYLLAGSDPWQLRLQIGHETFHRVCSQGRVFHWTHEMFACLVSTRLLRRFGLADYAAKREQEWEQEADRLPLCDLRATNLWTGVPYPFGFYGRAFVTGARLVEAVGWQRLRPLARAARTAAPDVTAAWLAALPDDARARALAVLADDTPASDAPARVE